MSEENIKFRSLKAMLSARRQQEVQNETFSPENGGSTDAAISPDILQELHRVRAALESIQDLDPYSPIPANKIADFRHVEDFADAVAISLLHSCEILLGQLGNRNRKALAVVWTGLVRACVCTAMQMGVSDVQLAEFVRESYNRIADKWSTETEENKG